jgi:hypothetical protein
VWGPDCTVSMFLLPMFELIMAITFNIAYVCNVTLSPSFRTNISFSPVGSVREFYPEDIVGYLGFIKCEEFLSELRDF